MRLEVPGGCPGPGTRVLTTAVRSCSEQPGKWKKPALTVLNSKEVCHLTHPTFRGGVTVVDGVPVALGVPCWWQWQPGLQVPKRPGTPCADWLSRGLQEVTGSPRAQLGAGRDPQGARAPGRSNPQWASRNGLLVAEPTKHRLHAHRTPNIYPLALDRNVCLPLTGSSEPTPELPGQKCCPAGTRRCQHLATPAGPGSEWVLLAPTALSALEVWSPLHPMSQPGRKMGMSRAWDLSRGLTVGSGSERLNALENRKKGVAAV